MTCKCLLRNNNILRIVSELALKVQGEKTIGEPLLDNNTLRTVYISCGAHYLADSLKVSSVVLPG